MYYVNGHALTTQCPAKNGLQVTLWGVCDSAAQQTQGVQSMKAQCWATVDNVGPTPSQPRLNISAWRDERLSFT